MKPVRRLLLAAFFAAALSGCGGGEEEGSGSNGNIELPPSLVGEAITFTVTNSGTAGIPEGFKIEWTFSAGGVIRGRNPVTNQIVTPDSYRYQASGNEGYVDVRYVQGNLTAYEIYTMRAITSNSGTYTYEGDTGTGVKTAAGTYSVR